MRSLHAAALLLLLAAFPAAAGDTEESLRADIAASEEYELKWRPQLENWERNKKLFVSVGAKEKEEELKVAEQQIETITAMLARNKAKREDLDARLAKVRQDSRAQDDSAPDAGKPKGKPVEDGPRRPSGDGGGAPSGGGGESSAGSSSSAGGGEKGSAGSGGASPAPKSALAGANLSGMLGGAAKGAAALKAGIREEDSLAGPRPGQDGRMAAGRAGPAGAAGSSASAALSSGAPAPASGPRAFDPSRPATDAELRAAAHSGYGESFERLGLRASAAGIVESDGRPASAQRLAALRADIASQPRARMYHPDYFKRLPRAHYEDLRRAAKDRRPEDEKDLKDVGLSADEKDFEYTSACGKIQGDCNPHAKEGYDKGDFVPPSALDEIWAALSEQEPAPDDAAASSLSGSRLGGAGTLERLARSASGWLGFGGDEANSGEGAVAAGSPAAARAPLGYSGMAPGPAATVKSAAGAAAGAPSRPRSRKPGPARLAFRWSLLLGLAGVLAYARRRWKEQQD